MKETLVAGIDLAVRRPSALCIAKPPIVLYISFVRNEYIPLLLSGLGVRVVAIDSPLSKPKGPWRRVDVLARKAGLKVLPPGWRGMRVLTEEGIRMKEELERKEIEVIETFPRAVKGELRYVYAYVEDRDLKDSLKACAVAYAYVLGEVKVVKAEDGAIYYI